MDRRPLFHPAKPSSHWLSGPGCPLLIFQLILLTLIAIASAPDANGAPNEEVEAAIVRIQVPLSIDGDVSDWEKITALHEIQNLAGETVGTFRLATDGTTLWGTFSVIDDSPLKNQSSTLEELFKGGDAVGILIGSDENDTLQQRILFSQVDGENIVMAYRPRWSQKLPHTFSSPVGDREMEYVGPIEGAHCAFQRSPEGYLVEFSLPLEELGLADQWGPTLPFDAQIISSDPAGTINTGIAWWNARGGPGYTTEDLPTEAGLYPESWGTARVFDSDPGPRIRTPKSVANRGIPIHFELDRAARVSLIITAPDGWIVQEILRAEKFAKGSHTVYWNGRDRYDEPLPPGKYTWKLAYFEGMGTRFHGSIGNSARPPYRTPDGMGSMGGQHGGSRLLASDEGGIYIVSGAEEGHPAMRKIDREGYTLWKRSMGGFGVGKGIATDDEFAYLLQQRRRGELFLVRLDP
ncbi:MAG: hypothetical protein ACQKBT_01560, partial [Puniceicoccales bacterium]